MNKRLDLDTAEKTAKKNSEFFWENCGEEITTNLTRPELTTKDTIDVVFSCGMTAAISSIIDLLSNCETVEDVHREIAVFHLGVAMASGLHTAEDLIGMLASMMGKTSAGLTDKETQKED